MPMKKAMAIGLGALMAVFLAACSDDGPAAGNDGKPGVPKETVTLRAGYFGGETRHKLMDQIVADFEKKNPGIKIELEFADIAPYYDKLSVQIAGNDAPDVFALQLERYGDFADRNQLLPLDDFIKNKEIDVTDINPRTLSAGNNGGKQIMVPVGNATKGAFYNADLFKRLGVEPPKFDLTWEEFAAKGAEVVKAANKPGFYFADDSSGSIDQLGFFTRQKGKDLYTPDGKLGFAKEDLIEWFRYWDDLRKQGIIPPAAISAEYKGKPPQESSIVKGVTAMKVDPGGANQMAIWQKFSDDRFELVRIPGIAGGKPGEDVGGVFMGIWSKSKHPKEAAKFVNYFLNDSDSAKIYKEDSGPVPSKKIADIVRPLITPEAARVDEFQQKVNPIINNPNKRPASSNDVVKQLGLASEAVAFGKKSVEQAVNDFFNESNKILK
ncbi:ABC transporter substrate-binding protein [Paenibacillus hamazuiensis]|uniref:ABC transporter substrate-binding protein n=1 Tax=Paenibacillus hamazuiensis TaxID=2936508 RepID=UPI00201090EE|nr:sugar ABC transporter substrate-binding protein [Paenibacillus hamazuiensis]